ncbi:MAG: endonuclease III domain-containing protein [Desulfobacula sp.]|nr:endonuclease III domain-containing protein [Desulfobacula sp.]
MLKGIYRQFLDRYGPQGWWPLIDFDGTNSLKKGATGGYHPLDYSFPQNSRQQFEIICGAVLTQNTTWVNAKKALQNLDSIKLLSEKKILLASDNTISNAIKPAGYKNQKREYLKNCAMFFHGLNGSTPTREKLLAVKGVGPETADSILLYAYKVPTFVVDAYTTRFLIHHRIIQEKSSYNQIKALLENALEKDYKIYQEFHALFVEHGKRFFSKKPYKNDLEHENHFCNI